MMPIYEYVCRACSHRFERLVRSQSGVAEIVSGCPACESQHVDRLCSSFAAVSSATKRANLDEGRKIANRKARDKQRAESETLEHHHH